MIREINGVVMETTINGDDDNLNKPTIYYFFYSVLKSLRLINPEVKKRLYQHNLIQIINYKWYIT